MMQGSRGRVGVVMIIGSMVAVTVACVGGDPQTSSPTNGTDAGLPDVVGSPPDPAVDASDGGSLAPDAAPSKNCPLGCLPPAPQGWTGPSAIYDGPFGTAPADCPATYTLAEVLAKRDIETAATTCACGTPQFTGGNCNYTVTYYTGTGCQFGADTTVRGSGTCIQHLGTAIKVIDPTLTTSGTCSFPNPVATKPDPVPAKATKACGLPQAASCSTERPDCAATPLPAAPFTRLCIHKDGDVDCPSEDYAVKILGYKDVTDDRACTACAGIAAGGVCATVFGWSNDIACAAPAGTQRGTGTSASANCYTTEGSRLTLYTPTGMSCNVSANSTPTGAVTPKDPVTFCCAK